MTKLADTSNEEDSFEKDEEKLLNALQKLRELIEEEKFLKVRTDDNFLLRYLRCSNYDPKIAIKKVRSISSLF